MLAAIKEYLPSCQSTCNVRPVCHKNTFTYQFYFSIELIPDWDIIIPENKRFLKKNYLLALEKALPQELSVQYTTVYDDKGLVGIAYFQRFYFDIEQDFLKTNKPKIATVTWKDKLVSRLESYVYQQAASYGMVCGNLLLTGEYGTAWRKDIDSSTQEKLFSHIVQKAKENFHKNGQKISFLMIKDFIKTHHHTPNHPIKKYIPIQTQACFLMNLPPHWKNFDDYLNDIHSKYRVRAKRALKKMGDLVHNELSYEEIVHHKDRLYELYLAVAKRADFNLFLLNSTYFSELKQELGNDFRLFTYSLHGEIIGFYTLIFNDDELEAHFLGFDDRFNHDYQIYLNILFHILREAIQQQVKSINFARTAPEIKSSVGAIAHEVCCCIQHFNPVFHQLLRIAAPRLNPKEEWLPRHPFKTSEAEAHE